MIYSTIGLLMAMIVKSYAKFNMIVLNHLFTKSEYLHFSKINLSCFKIRIYAKYKFVWFVLKSLIAESHKSTQ